MTKKMNNRVYQELPWARNSPKILGLFLNITTSYYDVKTKHTSCNLDSVLVRAVNTDDAN
jgi:hypothetical protein